MGAFQLTLEVVYMIAQLIILLYGLHPLGVMPTIMIFIMLITQMGHISL